MKTHHISASRAAALRARPAITLAVCAALAALAFAAPVHASESSAGHGSHAMPHAHAQGDTARPHQGAMPHGEMRHEGKRDGEAHHGAKHHGERHHGDKHHGEKHHGHMGHGGHARGGDRGAWMSERMLDRLQATPEQKTRIREIMAAARKDLQAQRADGRSLRDQGMQLFAQPEIDAKAIEALRAQAMARRDAASKRMTQAMVEAGQVLTPAQRQQLAQHMAQRQERMRRHHEGHGAPQAPRS